MRDYLRLWPLWKGDDRTFGQLVDATIPLVRAHYSVSSALGTGYYESFRRAEQVPGSPATTTAPAVDVDRVAVSLHVTGRVMTARALAAGQTPEQAMRTALVRTSGAVARHVVDGGRGAVLGSVLEDEQALGWARVTAGKPCAFCAMLASRGPVYKTEGTAGFDAHDHCACGAEPTYDGSEWPDGAREFRDLWNRHKNLNDFRRALSA